MSLFVSFSFASMENDNALFGNMVIDIPAVDDIVTEHDLREVERQILARFGMPDAYRWVVVHNWKWLPERAIKEEVFNSLGDIIG